MNPKWNSIIKKNPFYRYLSCMSMDSGGINENKSLPNSAAALHTALSRSRLSQDMDE